MRNRSDALHTGWLSYILGGFPEVFEVTTTVTHLRAIVLRNTVNALWSIRTSYPKLSTVYFIQCRWCQSSAQVATVFVTRNMSMRNSFCENQCELPNLTIPKNMCVHMVWLTFTWMVLSEVGRNHCGSYVHMSCKASRSKMSMVSSRSGSWCFFLFLFFYGLIA